MKILFVVHAITPGGAENVLTMLANSFSDRGYDVSIVFFGEGKPFYYLNPNIKLIRKNKPIYKKNIFGKIKLVLSTLSILKNVFVKEESDIIISFLTGMNIFSIVSARLAGKKIIVSEHTNYLYDAKNIFGFLRRLIYPFADKVIILTNYDKEKYSFLKNTHVIKNPLVLKNEYHNIEREKIILGVGRLVELKQFDLLINVFNSLKAEGWKLIILGEGPKRDELERMIKQLKLSDKVYLPGLTKDMESYYKRASLFVLSSRIEGFPGALCEAMGYGCPSVAFDCISGPSDIIENNLTGVLVEPGNIKKLNEEMQKVIDNPIFRNKLSLNSKTIVSELDIMTISKKWIQIFEYVKNNG